MKIATTSNFPAAQRQPDLFNLPPRVTIGARDTDTSRAAAVKTARKLGDKLNAVQNAQCADTMVSLARVAVAGSRPESKRRTVADALGTGRAAHHPSARLG